MIKSFQILIDVTEDDLNPEFFAVDFRFNSTGKSLLKKLPNIDLSKDVALVGYAIDGTNSKGEAVKNYYAVPYQGEISKAGKVLPAYTKEEPNGYPEMKKIKVKEIKSLMENCIEFNVPFVVDHGIGDSWGDAK